MMLNIAGGVPTIETVEATAYTWTGNKMANGLYPTEGYVASNKLPLGTKIYIPEMGQHYIVGDRIGHSSELDIYMDSRNKAINFGRKNLIITYEKN